MLATAVTLALLGFAATILADLFRDHGQKIMAALKGRSWISQPPLLARPITVRLNQRYPASRPMRAQPEWRAAA